MKNIIVSLIAIFVMMCASNAAGGEILTNSVEIGSPNLALPITFGLGYNQEKEYVATATLALDQRLPVVLMGEAYANPAPTWNAGIAFAKEFSIAKVKGPKYGYKKEVSLMPFVGYMALPKKEGVRAGVKLIISFK